MTTSRCAVLLACTLCGRSAGAVPPSRFEALEYRFEVDPSLGTEAGVVSITSAARLALRELDAMALGWDGEASEASAVALRAAMLVFVDMAIVSYATMLLSRGTRARRRAGRRERSCWSTALDSRSS